MKANIHPKWSHQAKVTCACGNTFTTGSTQEDIHVDICSACHPFYTGSMKFVDVQGRVDRFEKMRKVAEAKKAEGKTGKKEKAVKAEPLSLKEMLEAEKKKLAQTA